MVCFVGEERQFGGREIKEETHFSVLGVRQATPAEAQRLEMKSGR